MNGKEMCSLKKDDFCGVAPVFVGDILWEHLQLLQQECDKELSALKYAAPKLSETSPQLPVSPPRNMTPFSPRTYTNLDQAPVYQHRTQHNHVQQHFDQRYTPSPHHDQRVSPAPHTENRVSPAPPIMDNRVSPALMDHQRISPVPVKTEYPVKQEYSTQYNLQYAQYTQYPPRTMYQYPPAAAYQQYMPVQSHPYFPATDLPAAAALPVQPPRWTPNQQQSYQVLINILSMLFACIKGFRLIAKWKTLIYIP